MPKRRLFTSAVACAVLACLYVPAVPSATADGAPGHSGPGGACRADNGPRWLAFACRYLTAQLWRAAGRPEYTAQDGSHWRPWYYGDVAERGHNLLYEGFGFRPRNEGLLEAMQDTDRLPDEYDPAYVSRYWSLFRYTPWSVHFQRELGCGEAQIADPYALTASPVHRSELLGMGWPRAGADPKDPTGDFSKRALGAMLALAEGAPGSGPGRGDSVRRRIDALARNGGVLRSGKGAAAAGAKFLSRLGGGGRHETEVQRRCIGVTSPAGGRR